MSSASSLLRRTGSALGHLLVVCLLCLSRPSETSPAGGAAGAARRAGDQLEVEPASMDVADPALTWIRRGLASSATGTVTVSTPWS